MSRRSFDIHPMRPEDRPSASAMLGEITREGCWWYFPRTSTDEEMMRLWEEIGDVFVAEIDGGSRGTFVIGAHHYSGPHIASCGYAVATDWRGQGIADALCKASIREAADRGYRAIQLNSVLSTNRSSVSLYERNGFETIGRVPEAFLHPTTGYVDTLIMYRKL